MSDWNDFYVAVAGASAALAGLIFVGVSINLTKILSFPTLPNRAVTSMILLLAILLASILLLVPRQTDTGIGCVLCALGAATWILVTRIDLRSLRLTEKDYKRQYGCNALLNQLAVLPYLAGGVWMLALGKEGLYAVVAAIVVSLIKAVSEAWVLLVEINR